MCPPCLSSHLNPSVILSATSRPGPHLNTLTRWEEKVRTSDGVAARSAKLSNTNSGSGWLFLFAVLMAAGLLFTMVFFVSQTFELKCLVTPIDHERLPRILDHNVFRPRM